MAMISEVRGRRPLSASRVLRLQIALLVIGGASVWGVMSSADYSTLLYLSVAFHASLLQIVAVAFVVLSGRRRLPMARVSVAIAIAHALLFLGMRAAI